MPNVSSSFSVDVVILPLTPVTNQYGHKLDKNNNDANYRNQLTRKFKKKIANQFD